MARSALPLIAAAAAAAGCAGPRSGAFFGQSRGEEAPEKVYEVRWLARADETFDLPYQPVELASPEVDPASGTSFVATADGLVHAYDRAGRELWVHREPGTFDAGPTFFEGRLYLSTAKGKLLAMDAASGRILWTWAGGDELMTQPTAGPGLIYVVGASDTLFAIDQQTGTWKWQYRRETPGEFTIRGAARPLFLEGKVYAGFADGFAVCLDAKDGALRWAKDLGQGKAYADVDAGPLLDGRGRVLFASYATGVRALDLASGDIAWSVDQPGVSALALDARGGRVWAGGAGFLNALDLADGAAHLRLSFKADRAITGLGLVNDLVVATTGPGPMLFVDARTGRLRRTFDPGRGVSAPATLGSGRALVLSNRGVLYALDVVAWGRR
jgi:outer membrane protein assembly factor BamB